MDRYHNLFVALNELRQRTKLLRFLEVGTYNGVRASQLLSHWLRGGDEFLAEYVGFDMFEDMTPELTVAEKSKTVLPPSRKEVMKRITTTVPTLVSISLFKGNTKETLPAQCPTLDAFDLIFIDGGHSLETIASDWNAVKQCMDADTIVLFDDYYDDREDFGCKHEIGKIVEELRHEAMVPSPDAAKKYDVTLLEPMDHYEHTQVNVRMVRVQLAKI